MKLNACVVVLGFVWFGSAQAHGGNLVTVPVPPELSVTALPSGVEDLKFAEIFRLPVGPAGLEPSDKLLRLSGKTVRIVGYMAGAERPTAGRLILTSLPVTIDGQDESLSDDLPPNAVFVHLAADLGDYYIPNLRGLVQLIGTLQVGAQDEPDGRVSSVRLLLGSEPSRWLAESKTRRAALLSPQP